MSLSISFRGFIVFALLIALSMLTQVSVTAAPSAGEQLASRVISKNLPTLKIAVASNFAATAKLLIQQYQRISSKKLSLVVGSTGKLTAQIQYGLAVDLFLAADQHSPITLEQKGFAVSGSYFNYARGRLVLWSEDASLVDAKGQVLIDDGFTHLAIANPRLAPYGQAAIQLLRNKGIAKKLSSKIVRGDSVGQAFQFTASGNAEIGLLAYSQVFDLAQGSYWLVPNYLHDPIVQTGVIIKDSMAVRDFVDFLQSEEALSLIEAQGYLRP